MAFTDNVLTRYVGIARGAVVMTGNTCGLDKASAYSAASDPYFPGNFGSSGVFLTLSNTNAYPSNWTSIHNSNQTPSPIGIIQSDQVSSNLKIGSSAKLFIPMTVERILHAELVWFANINPAAGVDPDTTIQFQYPNAQNPLTTETKLIDSSLFKTKFDLTSQDISESWRIYVRSADVTDYIIKGEYTYSVQGISAAIRGGDDQSNCSGWYLMAAYEDPTMDYNNLSLYVICIPVSSGNTVQIQIPNIVTPSSGDLKGKAIIAAAEGDIRYTGDYARFGATIDPSYTLSIGNHTANNFFVGEISIADNDTDIGGSTTMGAPDTRGSMGNNNHNTANTISGARHGLDITRVDINNALTYNQQSAYMKFGSNGDVYIPIGFGCQIGISSLLIKTASTQVVDINDTITYTTIISNNGAILNKRALWFQDTLPHGIAFVPGSVQVFFNGILQSGFENADPTNGFLLKPLFTGYDTITVKFDAILVDYTLIPNCTIENTAKISYYVIDSAGNRYDYTEKSDAAITYIEHGELQVKKINDPSQDITVTCDNIIDYTIELENIACVDTVIAVNEFSDPLPNQSADSGTVTSSSNQPGYDNTSIAINNSGTAIVNVKQLTVRPKEIITINFSGILIC